MINYNQTLNPIIRTCTAPFLHTNDAGELQTHQIRVRYKSLTTKEIKERRAELLERQKTDPHGVVYLSETLARRITELPDLIGENGEPIPVTEEFLETLMVENLQAMEQAIADASSEPAK